MKKMTSVLALLTIMMGLSTSVKAQDVTHYDKPSDLKVNQAILTLKDQSRKYYNTEELDGIGFDGAEVRVTPKGN